LNPTRSDRFTRCPECDTTFRVTSEQLTAAGGKVRCGHCRMVFNAFFHLLEAPGAEEPPATAAGDEGVPAAEASLPPPDHRLAEDDLGLEVEHIELSGPAPAADAGEAPDAPLDTEVAESPPPEPEPEAEAPPPAPPEAPEAAAGAGEAPAPEAPETPAEPPVVDDEDVPLALRESLAAAARPRRGPLATAALGLAALGLAVLLAGQVLSFRGYQLAHARPALAPLVRAWCARLPCYYTGRRDPAQIRLLNRDIRNVAGHDGVLRITATLVNAAPFPQPWPAFEVVLFDLSGAPVARRRFAPAEYLGELSERQLLMAPGQPVQIRLDVLDPGRDAVNFEINLS